MSIINKLNVLDADLRHIDTKVNSQSDLISQISIALQGKAIGPNTTVNETALISRSLSGEYTNDNVETVGDYAFYGCSDLTDVNMSKCKKIKTNAFTNCSSLVNVTFPRCISLEESAFGNCEAITTASFGCCSIPAHTFCDSNLKEILINAETSSKSTTEVSPSL